MKGEIGCLEGEVCGRNGCTGIIEEKDIDGSCSCHINPPCSYCEQAKEYCPECEWDAKEEQEAEEHAAWQAEMAKTPERKAAERRYWELVRIKHPVRRFDPNNLNYRIRSHTNASQICEGWFPSRMSKEDVRKQVNGTFGGRFESFDTNTQTFRFVAYTD